jgi:hypothetical protein
VFVLSIFGLWKAFPLEGMRLMGRNDSGKHDVYTKVSKYETLCSVCEILFISHSHSLKTI